MNSARWLAALALVALLQACGGEGGMAPTPDTTAPTAPTALTAAAQSATTIQLVWQASSDAGTGVAGYRIYRNGGATPVGSVTTPGFMDTGLAAATAYSYTVRAFDGASPANVSVDSAAASATTLAVAGGESGLDSRPSNTSCLAGDAPTSAVSLALQRVFPGLSFSQPILMLQEPASSDRWYVAQQTGIVYAFDNQPATTTRRVFIDVSSTIAGAVGGEMGLLGMAFHPDWQTNRRAYLSYTAIVSGQRVSRIVEYQSQDNGLTLSAATARVILQTYQPEENHNGGHIAFGPDGFLYIGFGDGGGGGDGHGAIGNGQRLSTLLGKMLRIDVNGTTGSTPYAIPAGNPYPGTAVCNNDTGAFTQNCPEIYAYGFRNPWRWSFDTESRELWVADVGQGAWEEVDLVVAGGNYGWRCYEGNHTYGGTPTDQRCGSNWRSSLPPVAEYSHAQGSAITGGYVYRGSSIPALAGRYVFGDFGSQRIWTIARDTTPTIEVTTGFASGQSVSAFAQDHEGEIYVVGYGGGLYRLAAGTGGGRVIPTQLSATGCVSATNATQPASGLIPYSPNAPFWSDNATKARWLALPDGQNIIVNGENDFEFPDGTVLVKNFRLNSRLIETRLFMRHNNGSWAGYTYEWNTAGTDAIRVVGGKNVTVEGQSWRFPSEAQCVQCHTNAAGSTLGLEIAQLNGLFGYPQTGCTANQLTTFNTLGMLTPALAQPVAQLPRLFDPYGSAGTLTERARSYLHTNCAQCHRPGGPTSVNMDLRYTTPLAQTNACDVVPANALGVTNARRIATGAGAAARSMIVVRASRTDANAMPPMQPRVVDAAGMQLLTDWTNSLASCN